MTRESTFWQRITFESGARRLEQQRRRALVESPAVEAGGFRERCEHPEIVQQYRFGERRFVCVFCGTVTGREQLP